MNYFHFTIQITNWSMFMKLIVNKNSPYKQVDSEYNFKNSEKWNLKH